MNQSGIHPPFKVDRREPELITPAKATPHEFKALSDIDDQDSFRFHIPIVQVYPHNPYMEGIDPAKVIKDAIAKSLVFYYPFAGRLRELEPSRKLIVECTGEGVLFIEADANVTLHQSGNSLHPLFPYLDEILYDVPGSSGVLNCPLLLFQVTRLKCGGFVLAVRFHHSMTDGPGFGQFMSAVGEIARGKEVPSIMPVWQRHVLSANNPPNPTCFHPEYENFPSPQTNNIIDPTTNNETLSNRAIFFGPKQLSQLRKLIPTQFQHCSTFELITACVWKCRTSALQPNPAQIMRMIFLVNARYKRFDPPILPEGYYGNGFVLSTAISTAEELIGNPVGYALGLIRKAKENVNREYIQSSMDSVVSKGRAHFQEEGSCMITDNTRSGFRDVDLGWGNAIYGGPPRLVLSMACCCFAYQNDERENGTLVLISLPALSMERFEKEINNLLEDKPANSSIKSSL